MTRIRTIDAVPRYELEPGTVLIRLGRIRYRGPRGIAGNIRRGSSVYAFWLDRIIPQPAYIYKGQWLHCRGDIAAGRYGDLQVLYIKGIYGDWKHLPLEYR